MTEWSPRYIKISFDCVNTIPPFQHKVMQNTCSGLYQHIREPAIMLKHTARKHRLQQALILQTKHQDLVVRKHSAWTGIS